MNEAHMKVSEMQKENELKREIASGEASRDTFYGDVEVSENSGETEILSFLEKYQNAVISNLKGDVDTFMKKIAQSQAEEKRLNDEIAKWNTEGGNEEVVANLTHQANALNDGIFELTGGSEGQGGKLQEVQRALDQAIHIKDALVINKTHFVETYRSQIATMKEGSSPRISLE